MHVILLIMGAQCSQGVAKFFLAAMYWLYTSLHSAPTLNAAQFSRHSHSDVSSDHEMQPVPDRDRSHLNQRTRGARFKKATNKQIGVGGKVVINSALPGQFSSDQ